MTREFANKPYRIQKKIENDPEVKERMCLKCLLTFVSQWAGNRICDVCKNTWNLTASNEVTTHGSYDTGQKPKARPRD